MHTLRMGSFRASIAILAMTFGIAGATAQTAEELVEKNIAAKGGMANIKAITSKRMAWQRCRI